MAGKETMINETTPSHSPAPSGSDKPVTHVRYVGRGGYPTDHTMAKLCGLRVGGVYTVIGHRKVGATTHLELREALGHHSEYIFVPMAEVERPKVWVSGWWNCQAHGKTPDRCLCGSATAFVPNTEESGK